MRKLIIFSCCVFLCSPVGAQRLPVEYGFFHELSNRPRLAPHVIGPMINLEYLDFLIKQSLVESTELQKDVYNLGKLRFFNRRKWTTWMRLHRRNWYGMWEVLNEEARKTKPAKYQALIKYLDEAVAYAPVMPYVYDAKQRPVAALHEARMLGRPSIVERGAIRKGEVDSVPFCFLDYDVTEEHMKGEPKFTLSYIGTLLRLGLDFHGLTIPLFGYKKGKKWVYQMYYREDVKGRSRIKVEDLAENIQDALNKYPPKAGMLYRIADVFKKTQPAIFNGLVKQLRKRLRLSQSEAENVVLWRPRKTLRWNKIRELEFDVIGGLSYKGGYRKEKKTYIPFRYGLYKLMLLYLGIDEDNNEIKKGDDTWGVSQDLQQLIKDMGWNHPWRRELFSKDKFLNYEIAQVLKDDPKLFQRVKRTIDFSLKPLGEFENLVYKGKYFRVKPLKGQKSKKFIQQEVEDFLPGREQAVAMMLLEAVHYLWIYACWFKRAQAIGLGFAFHEGTLFWQVGWLLHLQDFVNRAHKQRRAYPMRKGAWYWFNYRYWFPKRASFVEIWGQVVNALQTRWRRNRQSRENWIAFDGKAGFVMSFDPLLIEMQKASPVTDQKLLDELRFAGVDHYYAYPLFTEKEIREYWKLPFVG